MTQANDAELVRLALDRVSAIDSNRAAARELGVSEGTIRRWRSADVAMPLRDKVRHSLRKALGEEGAEVAGGEIVRAGHGEPFLEREARLAEERMRTMRLDAETRLREAEAAVIRARAYERAEANAELRTWVANGFRAPEGEDEGEALAPLAPGEATRLLRQFLRGLRQGERPDRTERDDRRTSTG